MKLRYLPLPGLAVFAARAVRDTQTAPAPLASAEATQPQEVEPLPALTISSKSNPSFGGKTSLGSLFAAAR